MLASYSKMLRDQGLQGYFIIPRLGLTTEEQRVYWEALAKTDYLAQRFCSFENVDVDMVLEYMEGSEFTYFIADIEAGKLVGEFTLENFIGKAAQMHFSSLPSNSAKLNLFLSNEVSDQILNFWKDTADVTKTFVDALYGLTPVPNRVATLFVLKSGFTKFGVIPSTVHYAGELVPATLTVKTRSKDNGWG